jgi:hypothetical protein
MGYNYDGNGEPRYNGVSRVTNWSNGVSPEIEGSDMFRDAFGNNCLLMHENTHPSNFDDPSSLDGTHSHQDENRLPDGSIFSPTSNGSTAARSHYPSGGSDLPSDNGGTPSSFSAMSSAGSRQSHYASSSAIASNSNSSPHTDSSEGSYANIDENSLEPAQLALRLSSTYKCFVFLVQCVPN